MVLIWLQSLQVGDQLILISCRDGLHRWHMRPYADAILSTVDITSVRSVPIYHIVDSAWGL